MAKTMLNMILYSIDIVLKHEMRKRLTSDELWSNKIINYIKFNQLSSFRTKNVIWEENYINLFLQDDAHDYPVFLLIHANDHHIMNILNLTILFLSFKSQQWRVIVIKIFCCCYSKFKCECVGNNAVEHSLLLNSYFIATSIHWCNWHDAGAA